MNEETNEEREPKVIINDFVPNLPLIPIFIYLQLAHVEPVPTNIVIWL